MIVSRPSDLRAADSWCLLLTVRSRLQPDRATSTSTTHVELRLEVVSILLPVTSFEECMYLVCGRFEESDSQGINRHCATDSRHKSGRKHSAAAAKPHLVTIHSLATP